jgi:transcriptional regulator with XRE-family HTH domain
MSFRLEPNPHLAAFGALVRRKRISKQLSLTELCKVTGVSSSHMCYIEVGKVRVGAPSMRLIAAVLSIADVEAWIVAVHGLEGPFDIETARRLCEVLQIENQPTPNVPSLMARLKPMLTCTRCNHSWRKKTANRPAVCPQGLTSNYDQPWDDKLQAAYTKAQTASKAFWSTKTKPQRKQEPRKRMAGGAK